MHIDFAIIDTDLNEKEAKKQISDAIQFGVNSICIPYYLIRSTKILLEKKQIDLSCFVDFPIGISDNKTRLEGVKNAIMAGANCIDIVMPQNLATNRKYDKIRDDVKAIKEICDPINVKIRYILEYRIFDHRCLKKICEIFDNTNIMYVFPSTGYFLDNLADNLIACAFLHQNSKELNVICSGDIWLEKHFDIIYRSGIGGLRTFSPHIVKNFRNFLDQKK
jgi:deoxyribose-phosphate aldolase